MRKKIGILLVILTIVIIPFKILNDKYNPSYTLYKISEMTKKEQREIKEFYDDEKISKGKLFDIDYIEYNSTDDSGIQFLKKTKSHIPDLKITVYDELTNEEIGWVNMPVDYTIFMGSPYYENKMILYPLEGNILWQFKTGPRDCIKPLDKNRNLKKLKLIITYRNGKEIHHIEAP